MLKTKKAQMSNCGQHFIDNFDTEAAHSYDTYGLSTRKMN